MLAAGKCKHNLIIHEIPRPVYQIRYLAMGLFTFTINPLYSFGRVIERISIRTGTGAFKSENP